MRAPTRPASLAVLEWLPKYRAEWVRADVVAGLTLAAYLLPAGIGDASLAGLPPEAGLYACLFSGLIFWLFCSSTRTVITVTSALSLLIGASVGALSAGDPTRHAALAACVALLAGAEFIAELHKTPAARGIELRLADVHGDVRDALGRFGFDRVQGPLESGQTVHAIVSQWQSDRDRAGRDLS